MGGTESLTSPTAPERTSGKCIEDYWTQIARKTSKLPGDTETEILITAASLVRI